MGLVQSAAQVDVHRPRMPQPLHAGLPWLSVALVLLAGALFGIDARYLVAAAAGCLLVGAVRALLELRELWALRRAADAVLRTGARVHPYSALLTWRAAELTSRRNRKVLAHSLRNIVRELERPSLTSAVPLNRRQAREHASLLAELSQRLGAIDSTVVPHGVVLVEDLLTDGAHSPLYRGGDARPDLGLALSACLAALGPAASTAGPRNTAPDVFDPSAADHGRVSAHGGGN